MSRVRTYGAELAVRARSEIEKRRRRVELKVWRRTERGLQVEEEESVVLFKHRGLGQARWAFRAWGSGGDGIYRAHTQRAVRERGRRTCPPGND